jgi:homoserine dehydrogenase
MNQQQLPVYVYLVGASGLIGNEVAKMLVDLPDKRIVLRGICDSKHALYLSDPGIIEGWKVNKDVRWRVSDYTSSVGVELMSQYDGSREALMAFTSPPIPNASSHISIVIDCTASEIPSSLYHFWLIGGTHVVTANKKGTYCTHTLRYTAPQ